LFGHFYFAVLDGLAFLELSVVAHLLESRESSDHKPPPTLNQFAVHYRNLAGGTSKRDKTQLEPKAKGFGKRNIPLFRLNPTFARVVYAVRWGNGFPRFHPVFLMNHCLTFS